MRATLPRQDGIRFPVARAAGLLASIALLDVTASAGQPPNNGRCQFDRSTCGGCPPDMQTVSVTFPQLVPVHMGTRTEMLATFDDSLGQLVGVQLTSSVSASDGRFQLENLDPVGPCMGNPTLAWVIDSNVSLFDPNLLPAGTPFCDGDFMCSGTVPDLDQFDGMLDYGGTSGSTQHCTPQPTGGQCADTCYVSVAQLETFKRSVSGPAIPITMRTQVTETLFVFCGKVSATFRIRLGATVTATYFFCPINQPPVTGPDFASVCSNVPGCPTPFVDIPVLANDCDDDQMCFPAHGRIDCGSLAINQPPTKGTAVIMGCSGESTLTGCPQTTNCPGCFVRYTPFAGETGQDVFTYDVADNEGDCTIPDPPPPDPPTPGCTRNTPVTVTILTPPDVADDPGVMTCRNTPVTIDVLANDSAPPGASIVCNSLMIVTPPMSESAIIGPCGPLGGGCPQSCVTYTPAAGFCGTDSFTYKVQDTRGCCDTATVTVTVVEPPTADPDAATTCEEEPVVIGILDGDTPGTCPTSSPIDCSSVMIVSPPMGGSIELNVPCGVIPNGGCAGSCVRYTPDPGFRGIDTFTYRIKSAVLPCLSNAATVTVTVRCRPDAADDVVVKDPNDSTPVVIDVLANDRPFRTGVNDAFCAGKTLDPGSLMLLPPTDPPCPGPQFGTAAVVNGRIVYTQTVFPLPPGGDRFSYKVRNSNSCFDTACVRVVFCPQHNYREPASLLLYPEFDNRPGRRTLYTVTNTKCFGGNIQVEVIYISRTNCLESNLSLLITPCDTFTAFTFAQNPPAQQGYLYAFAKSQGQAISYDHLVGNLVLIDAFMAADYAVNPLGFGAIPAEGLPTDLDGDGNRDLDEIEYWGPPERLLVPRFVGQDAPGPLAAVQGELVLLNLSGGSAFTTIAELRVFNDNEVPFSVFRQFYCWDKVPLAEISSAFLESYLDGTANDPAEILGSADREAGWFWFQGHTASSVAETIVRPAVYGFLVERIGLEQVADLPWELCSQLNGSLLPNGIYGDPVPGFPNGRPDDNR